jgi:AcrR family transcriptional regulator
MRSVSSFDLPFPPSCEPNFSLTPFFEGDKKPHANERSFLNRQPDIFFTGCPKSLTPPGGSMTTVTETRQQQILKAAAACFVRRGFHQSTMQEICREADLSPGSVYRYYRGKEEIIAALVEASCADFLSLFEAVRDRTDIALAFDDLADAVLDKIRDPALCILHIEANAEALRNPKMAEIVERRDAAIFSALANMIRQAQSKGVMDEDLDPGMSAEILVALIKGLAMRKSIHPKFDTLAHGPILKIFNARFLQTREA